ncbi:MAG: cbb3-type cytochrome c oxidase subunit II [Pirellulaceae bacterium]
MFESKAGIIFIAGIGFFALAFVSNVTVPVLMYRDLPEQTAEQVVNPRLMYQFHELSRRYPETFKKYIGDPTPQACADALRLGRQLYVGEGCFHCHSQFVRPVSNDAKRFGAVSETWEYQNELQRPVLFGTRRVGPDLCREGGRRSSDWHAVHFFRPQTVSPASPMPEYPWLFDGSPDKPNDRGLALITYVQWLGSWLPSYPYYEELEQLKQEEAY